MPSNFMSKLPPNKNTPQRHFTPHLPHTLSIPIFPLPLAQNKSNPRTGRKPPRLADPDATRDSPKIQRHKAERGPHCHANGGPPFHYASHARLRFPGPLSQGRGAIGGRCARLLWLVRRAARLFACIIVLLSRPASLSAARGLINKPCSGEFFRQLAENGVGVLLGFVNGCGCRARRPGDLGAASDPRTMRWLEGLFPRGRAN